MNGPQIYGELPAGTTFAISMDGTNCAIRVQDRVAVLHPQWMTLSQAEIIRDALTTIIDEATR